MLYYSKVRSFCLHVANCKMFWKNTQWKVTTVKAHSHTWQDCADGIIQNSRYREWGWMCCYKRIQWSQLLQGVDKHYYKRYNGRSYYNNWGIVIKGYSGRSCYWKQVSVIIKGYSGCSYYSALKNVLMK